MLSAQKFNNKKIIKICGNEKTVHLEMCTKINFTRRGEVLLVLLVYNDLLNLTAVQLSY